MSPSAFHKIPKVLRDKKCWVGWRYDRLRSNGKHEKPLFNPRTLNRASTTDSTTWGTFDEAIAAYQNGGFDGIGFVFNADEIVGIDIDNCRNPETGEIAPWAWMIIKRFASYTEVSPSGTGVHIFIRASLAKKFSKVDIENGHVEIYDRDQYFTVTGHALTDTPLTVESRQSQLDEFIASFPQPKTIDPQPATFQTTQTTLMFHLADNRLIETIAKSKQGAKFKRLRSGDTSGYQSQSEADLALCRIYAFWTGNDATRVDRLFRQSGLYRRKWDEKHYRTGETYGRKRVAKACQGVTLKPRDPDLSQLSPEDRQRLALTNRLIKLHQWKGSVAKKCRKVAESLLTFMVRGHRADRVEAALRPLELHTGYSKQRVSRYLEHLTGKVAHDYVPVLFSTEQWSESKPNPKTGNFPGRKFSLLKSIKLEQLLETGGTLSRACSNLTDSELPTQKPEAHDAFRTRQGMSVSVEEVWEFIQKTPVKSGAELSRLTGMSPSTALRALKTLRAEGMIEKVEKQWVAITADLNEVARRRGTLGARENTQKEHEYDRERYRDWVERGKPRKGKPRKNRNGQLRTVPKPEVAMPVDINDAPTPSVDDQFIARGRDTWGWFNWQHAFALGSVVPCLSAQIWKNN